MLATHFAKPFPAEVGPLGPFKPLCDEKHLMGEGLTPIEANVTCEGCLKALQAERKPATPESGAVP